MLSEKTAVSDEFFARASESAARSYDFVLLAQAIIEIAFVGKPAWAFHPKIRRAAENLQAFFYKSVFQCFGVALIVVYIDGSFDKPSSESAATAPACARTEAPLNLAACLRRQNLLSLTPDVSSSSGTTLHPHLRPVKPCDLLRLEISIATSFAPSIS